MKIRRVFISTIMLIALIVTTIAVTSINTSAKTSAKIKLGNKKITLDVGGKAKISVLSKTKVKWKTSNKKVAAVSSKGVVKAKKAGQAKVTAYNAKAKAVCAIKVNKKSEKGADNKDVKADVSGMDKFVPEPVSDAGKVLLSANSGKKDEPAPTPTAICALPVPGKDGGSEQPITDEDDFSYDENGSYYVEEKVGSVMTNADMFLMLQDLSVKKDKSLYDVGNDLFLIRSVEEYNPFLVKLDQYFAYHEEHNNITYTNIKNDYKRFRSEFFKEYALLLYFCAPVDTADNIGGIKHSYIFDGSGNITVKFELSVNKGENVWTADVMDNTWCIAVVPASQADKIIDAQFECVDAAVITDPDPGSNGPKLGVDIWLIFGIDQQTITKSTTALTGTVHFKDYASTIKVKVGQTVIAEKALTAGEETFVIPVDFSGYSPGTMVVVTREYTGPPRSGIWNHTLNYTLE